MLAAVTPMAIYLFASINPSGLEIASAISLAAAICCVRFDSTLSTRTIGLSIQLLLFGSAVALSWARPISWLWAALLLLTLLPRAGLGGRRPLRGLHPAVITLVAANLVLAIAWTWYASRIRPVETSYADQWSQYPVLGRVLLVLLKFGDIVQQSIGVFGWLDTPLPSLAAFLLLASWTVIVVAAMWGAKPSALSPLVALLFLAAACACVALHSFVAAYGWQGRYVLPAIAAFFVLLVPSLSSLASRPAALQRLVWVLTPSVLSLQLLSLVWNMWRHAYGFASYNVRLPPAPLPLRPLGWSPLTGQESVLVLAMVGLLSIAISSLWSRRAPRDGYPLSGSGGTVREGTDLTVRSPSGGARPPG